MNCGSTNFDIKLINNINSGRKEAIPSKFKTRICCGKSWNTCMPIRSAEVTWTPQKIGGIPVLEIMLANQGYWKW